MEQEHKTRTTVKTLGMGPAPIRTRKPWQQVSSYNHIAHFSEECKFHSYSGLERAVRDQSAPAVAVDVVDWRSNFTLPPIFDIYISSIIYRVISPPASLAFKQYSFAHLLSPLLSV